ncbi:MAG: hypothetical protein ACRERV_13175, partial [Methylococcales bacterium]
TIFLLKGLALFKRQQNLYLIARLDPDCVEVERLLTHLAVNGRVAAATQNQAIQRAVKQAALMIFRVRLVRLKSDLRIP